MKNKGEGLGLGGGTLTRSFRADSGFATFGFIRENPRKSAAALVLGLTLFHSAG
jgi:hypothetical protein